MPLVVLSAYGHVKERVKEFLIWLLVMETGMLGVFLAPRPGALLLLLGGEPRPALLPGGHLGRCTAALRDAQVLPLHGGRLAGDAHRRDRARLEDRERERPELFERTAALEPATQAWIFTAFALAFAIKVPVLPFHTWLADAHTEAPTSGSVLLAGVLLKMGTYGLLRFGIQLFPTVATDAAPLFLALGRDRDRLRRVARDGAGGPQAPDRLLVRQPPRLRGPRALRAHGAGATRAPSCR